MAAVEVVATPGTGFYSMLPPSGTSIGLRLHIRIFYIYFRFLCEVDINDFRSNSIMRTNSSSILTRTKVSNNCIKGFGKVRARICGLQRQQAFRGVVIDFTKYKESEQ